MDLLVDLSLRRDYSSIDDGKANDYFISYRVSKVSIPHRDYCLLEHSRSAFPLLRVSEFKEKFLWCLYTLHNQNAKIKEFSILKHLMQLPDKQWAIATHITPNQLELLSYLCKKILILESQLQRQHQQIRHIQETQEIKISENQESIQEIKEVFDVIISDYRYLKDRNANLESLKSFHYPED